MAITRAFNFAAALALLACDDGSAAQRTTPDAEVADVAADTSAPPGDTADAVDDLADIAAADTVPDTADSAPTADAAPVSISANNPPGNSLIAAGEADFERALAGETNLRGQAILELSTGLSQTPDDARGQLMYGMALLSSVAEDGNVFAALQAEPALEKAMALAPDDLRIPGWLGTVKVGAARALNSGVDDAIQFMLDAADAYPAFNNVSLAIAFGHFPLDTPYPQMALDRLVATADCAGALDVCRNTTKVPHNNEGALMLFGDLYARIGDADHARAFYDQALASPDAATWKYAADARAVRDDLDARVAAYLDDDTTNDPPFFAEGKVACVACHQP